MECNLVWNHTRDFKIERARSASSIWNHKYDFRPKLHDPKFNYHFIRSILKSHNFMALNFRFWCNVPSRAGLLEIAEPETLWHLNLVCKTMSCDENSFKHNKQASSSEVRTNTASFMHRVSSPESMMENLPFFCGWGWDVSLSLDREFEGAAGAILRWISFELWNSLADCTMGSCGEFSFKYRSMALCAS